MPVICEQTVTYRDPLQRIALCPEPLYHYLVTTMASGQQDATVVDQQLRPAYNLASEAHEGQTRRQFGQPVITHPETVAIYLARIGLTSVRDAQEALIHDVAEDSNITWESIIDATSEEVAASVKYLTNPTDEEIYEYISNHGLSGEDFRWVKDELTQQRFLQALEYSPRALYKKSADMDHNMETVGEETPRQRKKTERKARRDMKLAPLTARLGLTGMAANIQNNAYNVLQPKAAERIARRQGELVNGRVIKKVGRMIDTWIDEAEPDPDVIYPLNTFDGEPLNYLSYGVETPTSYQVSQRAQGGKPPQDNDYMPCIRIVCRTKNDVFRWYSYLTKRYSLTTEERSNNPIELFEQTEKITKKVPFMFRNAQFELDVEVLTMDATIAPVHLDIEGSEMLEPYQRQLAQDRLEALQRSFAAEFEGRLKLGEPVDNQAERWDRGEISVKGRDGKVFAVVADGTVLDAAFDIWPKLGLEAVGGEVSRGERGVEQLLQLSSAALEGDQYNLYLVKDNPQLPSRIDLVTTKKAIRYIQEGIANTSPEIVKKDATFRGKEIMKWLYEAMRHRKLDIHFEYGLNQEFITKYGSLNEFAEQLGNVLRPARQDRHLDAWLGYAQGEGDISENVRELVTDAFTVMNTIADYRSKCPTAIVRCEDAHGIMELIGGISYELQANMMPLTVSPNFHDGARGIEIRATYTDPDASQKIGDIVQLIRDRGAAFGIQAGFEIG